MALKLIMLNLKKPQFIENINQGSIPPLYAEIPYNEPFKLYELYCLHHLGSETNTILLESLKGNFKIARFSFITFNPFLAIRVKDKHAQISGLNNAPNPFYSTKPLKMLKDIIMAYPQKFLPEIPPFQGGAIGSLSYDFVRYIEKIPGTAIDDLNIPDANFIIVDTVISFDHYQKKAWVVLSPGAKEIISEKMDISINDWKAIYDESEKIILDICDAINKISKKTDALSPSFNEGKNSDNIIRYEMTKEQYMDIVRKAKKYIAAGDIFQANLSQRISAYIGSKDTWELYKILRKINPSPFAVYADLGDYQVVSSSPERLIRVMNNIIDTRPIAGTRPRGSDIKEDELMRKELLLNEKERAEHIMLIDLERNDIGRVSRYGTVSVDELMITEDYSHVIHIVSNIRGVLQEGKTSLDVLRATFPGGTITGVPKVRCMEIIDELEPVQRGLYTGSFGYISFADNMDMNIIIRTFTIKDGIAYVQAGAGIVADSDPEREYYETLKKAEALLKTLRLL